MEDTFNFRIVMWSGVFLIYIYLYKIAKLGLIKFIENLDNSNKTHTKDIAFQWLNTRLLW